MKNMDREHVIEEECITYELEKGAEDKNCDDKHDVITLIEEDAITKYFIFKI